LAPPSIVPSTTLITGCGQVIATTAPGELRTTKGRAAFASSEGLAVYEIDADAIRMIDASASADGPAPKFRTPDQVTFTRMREQADESHTFGQDSLYEVSLASGETTELLRLPNRLLGYDWNPAGTVLAYQLRAETATQILPVAICAFDTTTRETRLVASIERPFGTATDQREEESITWSEDGRQILAVETAAQPGIFVVDQAGHQTVQPRVGTFARWLPDKSVLYQRDPQDTSKSWDWFQVSLADGHNRPFDLPDQAFRPALSPDGTIIAFDDGRSTPSVFLFNIKSKTIRELASGFVGPIWLSPTIIAATSATPRSPADSTEIPWSVSGATSRIEIATGELRPLALPSTVTHVTRFGVIDVLLAR
jgi:hypothetical protein